MGTYTTITSSDGFTLSAYQAEPEGTARGGVVVVQEIFGVNSHIRAVADRYAAAGYLAVAPAIFDRVRPGIELGYSDADMQEGAGIAFGQLDIDLVVEDVTAAGEEAGAAGKVGIVGYCFGGRITTLAAIGKPDTFSAASAYYGGGTPGLANRNPIVPMIAHYAELDTHIPMDGVRALEAAWPQVTIHTYPDADHGFNCDQRGTFHAQSAAVAQARTLRFFFDQLG
jgi:carboxymethylenebutenolidase